MSVTHHLEHVGDGDSGGCLYRAENVVCTYRCLDGLASVVQVEENLSQRASVPRPGRSDNVEANVTH